MKKPNYAGPLIWAAIGWSVIIYSLFVGGEQGRFLLLAGTLGWLKADLLAIQAELECWRK